MTQIRHGSPEPIIRGLVHKLTTFHYKPVKKWVKNIQGTAYHNVRLVIELFY